MSSSALLGLTARGLGSSFLSSTYTQEEEAGGWRAGGDAQGARLGLTCRQVQQTHWDLRDQLLSKGDS